MFSIYVSLLFSYPYISNYHFRRRERYIDIYIALLSINLSISSLRISLSLSSYLSIWWERSKIDIYLFFPSVHSFDDERDLHPSFSALNLSISSLLISLSLYLSIQVMKAYLSLPSYKEIDKELGRWGEEIDKIIDGRDISLHLSSLIFWSDR